MNNEKVNGENVRNYEQIWKAAMRERGIKTEQAVKNGELEDVRNKIDQVIDAAVNNGSLTREEILAGIQNVSKEESATKVNENLDVYAPMLDESAEKIVEEIDETPEEKTANIKELGEITKNSDKKGAFSFKKVIAAGVAAVAIAAVLAGCGKNDLTKQPVHLTVGEQQEAIGLDDEYISAAGEQQEAIGLKDGYDKVGMWLSENKTYENNFACAREVAGLEDIKGDLKEEVKYTAENQVESFATYIGSLPESLRPEDFKDLTINQAEQKLEEMSDEEYENTQKVFNDTIDKAEMQPVVLNGLYNNAFMFLKDSAGAVDHENMMLQRCVTLEENTEATKLVWKDANGVEIGSMIVKNNSDNGCMQPVSPISESKEYEDMKPISNDAKTPFTRAQIEEGGTGTMTRREQNGEVTLISEDGSTGVYNYETNTYVYDKNENSNPGEIIDNGRGQIGVVDTNEEAIVNANSDFATDHISEAEQARAAAINAAAEAQAAANAASAVNDQRATEVVQNVEQNGGATPEQIEQKNQEQAEAWNNGDFNLGG